MGDPGQPIAYRVAAPSDHDPATGASPAGSRLLTCARALDGMQKEALVRDESTGSCWRLLCDEGPWLNGTDLAPFPLGYFAAGLASCFLSDLHAEAAAQRLPAEGLGLSLDVRFTMAGSILRGTMAAGVDSIRVTALADPGVARADLSGIAVAALERRSVVNRALAAHLPSRFRLSVNGAPVAWPGDSADTLQTATDPAGRFDRLKDPAQAAAPDAIIHKAAVGPRATPGDAVGLQSEQKRSIHIAADACVRPDGLQAIGAQCVHPAGSRFGFLASADTRDNRAPGGTCFLSAGIGFCFMTQLGRYAQITKLALQNYRIVQRTRFDVAAPSPVETAVFLDSSDSPENNRKMVEMGERTCYVHTTWREPVQVSVHSGFGTPESAPNRPVA